jgi:hypothetical protein
MRTILLKASMVATDKLSGIPSSPRTAAISKLRRFPPAASAGGASGDCVYRPGEALLLTPFRSGAAHVVQLGTIRIENARRSFRYRCGEALSNFTRESGDEGEFMRDGGTGCHHMDSHLFPQPILAKGI